MDVDFNRTVSVGRLNIKLYEPHWKIKPIIAYLRNRFDGSDVELLGYDDFEDHCAVQFAFAGDEKTAKSKVETALKTYKHQES